MKKRIITNLKNHVLVATDKMKDSFYEGAVVYVCSHNRDGAVGLIVNRPLGKISFVDVLGSMQIKAEQQNAIFPKVLQGGSAEKERGFVLHGDDYDDESSIHLSLDRSLTATKNIIDAIIAGNGPTRIKFCLGYVGWDVGELEKQISEDMWQITEVNDDVLFFMPEENLYDACMAQITAEMKGQIQHTKAGRA